MFLSYGREGDSSTAKEVNSLFLNRQFLIIVRVQEDDEPLSLGALLNGTLQIRDLPFGKRYVEHHFRCFLHHHRDIVQDSFIVRSYVQCLTVAVS